MKASDYKPHLHGAYLFIGDPGTGKTIMATQFPRPLIINADNNIDGPIRFLQSNNLPVSFEFENITTDENDKIIPRVDRYRRMAAILQKAVARDDIDTIVLDSATSIADICMDEVRRQQGRKIAEPIPTNVTAKTIDEALQIQDWGAFFGLIRNLIITLKASGKILILTSHMKVEKDELSGMLRPFIAIPGQMSTIIAGYFTEVWKFSALRTTSNGVSTVERLISTVPGPREESLGLKTSLGLLPQEPIKFEHITKLIKGN